MYDKDCCYTPEPCNPCDPCDPCASPVPPPIRPVVNIPGPNVQAQMCEVVGRVNECIDRWNHIQRNCYEALQHTVGAAVSNDVYYDRDEVGFERGYSENDSCPYSIVRVACVDKKGKPIHVKLMPAFGNTTNSGLVQSIQDVSFVTNANAIITATADAPWKGVARYMGAPMAGTPDGGVMCGGFNRHGALKIFGGDTDEDTLCCNQMVDMIGSVIPIIIDGAVTEQAKGLTEKSAICAIGYKSGNGEKVFFDCGKQDVQGMQGVTVANILKDMGCTTAIITAMGPGGMEYLGGLASNPVSWKIPANAAYWVVSKRPFDGWCNQFESSIAQLVQRVGSLNNSLDFIRHDVDVAVEKAEQALEMAQDNADKIAVIQEQIKEIEQDIATIEGRLDAVEGDIEGLQNQIDELGAKLDQEIKDRENGDAQLQANLDKEIADRKVADAQLQTNIETEKSERIAADAVLQGNINQEAIDRANADLKIEQNLATEISNRVEADNILQNQINNIVKGDTTIPYVKKAGDDMTGDLNMIGAGVKIDNVKLVAHTDQDVQHLDINVGTDVGAVYINRNSESGGTGELHVTEVHAPHELRLNPGTNVNVGGKKITNVATPVDANDAVNKAYVDEQAAGKLTPATKEKLGGVIVGAGLEVTPEGVLSASGGAGPGEGYLPLAGGTMTGPIYLKSGEMSIQGDNADENAKISITAKQSEQEYGVVEVSQTGGFASGAVHVDVGAHNGNYTSGVEVCADSAEGASVVVNAGGTNGNVGVEISDKAKTELASGIAVNVGKRDTDYVVNVNSSRVENVPAPVKDGDAANKKYVDDAVKDAAPEGKFLPLAGGTMAASAVVGKTDTLQIGAGPRDGAGVYLSDTIGANMYVGDQTIAVSPNSKGATGGQKQSLLLCKVDNQNAVHCDNMRVVAVGDPVADGDAVNKKYVDAHSGGDYLPLSGGTMRGNINMGSNNVVQTGGISSGGTMSDGGAVLTQASSVRLNVKGQNQIECDGGSVFIRKQVNMDGKKIVSMADPTNPQDAVTKAYVDSKITGSNGGTTVVGTNYDGSTFTMELTANTGFSISKGPGMIGGFLYVEVTKLNVSTSSSKLFTVKFSSAPPPLAWATNVFTESSVKRNFFQDSLTDKTTSRAITHDLSRFTTGNKMLVIIGVACNTGDTNATTIAPLCVL